MTIKGELLGVAEAVPAGLGNRERHPEPNASTPRERDPHPWRATFVLTLLLIAGTLAWTMWLNPSLHDLNFWVISGDSWSPLAAGRYVSAGAYPYLYEADHTWVAGPLLPVLLAPVATIQDALRLTSRATVGYGFNLGDGRLTISDVPRPTVWILYGSFTMALCAVFLVALRQAVWAVLTSEDRTTHGRLAVSAQVVIAALGLSVTAGYWMHTEDVLGVAMLLFGICAMWNGRWTAAAVCLGLAIGFKQWTALPAVLLFPQVPRAEWRRFIVVGLGIPATLYGVPLLLSPAETMKSLFHATSGPWQGHAAPWIAHPSVQRTVAATPGRLVWVVGAVGLAWLLRSRHDPETLLASMVLIIAFRMATESVVYSYYLFGVMTFSLLLEVVQRRSVTRTTIVGFAAMAWFWLPPQHVWWWFVELALVGILVWPAIRSIARREAPPMLSGPTWHEPGSLAGVRKIDRRVGDAQGESA